MGRSSLEGMLEMGGSTVARDDILSWHLTSNHYPPVPSSMIQVCKDAIAKANEGLWDEYVELPKGISYRGSTEAPVRAIIEQHHLDSFLVSLGD